jgi:hypothetical protein
LLSFSSALTSCRAASLQSFALDEIEQGALPAGIVCRAADSGQQSCSLSASYCCTPFAGTDPGVTPTIPDLNPLAPGSEEEWLVLEGLLGQGPASELLVGSVDGGGSGSQEDGGGSGSSAGAIAGIAVGIAAAVAVAAGGGFVFFRRRRKQRDNGSENGGLSGASPFAAALLPGQSIRKASGHFSIHHTM